MSRTILQYRKSIQGGIQVILPAALAFAAGREWIPEPLVVDLIAILTAIGAAIWAVIENLPEKST